MSTLISSPPRTRRQVRSATMDSRCGPAEPRPHAPWTSRRMRRRIQRTRMPAARRALALLPAAQRDRAQQPRAGGAVNVSKGGAVVPANLLECWSLMGGNRTLACRTWASACAGAETLGRAADAPARGGPWRKTQEPPFGLKGAPRSVASVFVTYYCLATYGAATAPGGQDRQARERPAPARTTCRSRARQRQSCPRW
jgi:hypothetical protein